MYKLVLFGLLVLVVIAIAFGFFGILPFSGVSMLSSFIILGLVCYFTNFLFAGIYKVPTNSESYSITALILFFILLPVTTFDDVRTIVLVALIAMASKYLLAIKKKHIFNPAAIAVFIVGLTSFDLASWWVGSGVMLVPTLVLAFLVLRKINHFQMFFTFVIAGFLSTFLFGLSGEADFIKIIVSTLLSTSLIFLGSIMLTEPHTLPPQRKMQLIYAGLVGILFGTQFNIGPLFSTPALAIVIGNVFSYLVSPRLRLVLQLLEKNKLTTDVYEFVWKSVNTNENKISFEVGQYLEWTLGHKSPDMRGNRRYFTIASSPTESVIRLGIKSYENSSTFKKKLLSMNVGDTLVASQLSGEFTLPEDKLKKLVFIAGGIGITPFRSMVKYLMDTEDKRDVTLFYSNRTPHDIVYKDIFNEAKDSFAMKTIYTVNDLAGENQTEDMRVGFIDANMITKEGPDYKESMYYISGPHAMVTAFEDTLSKLEIPKKNIKVDFFPGYV